MLFRSRGLVPVIEGGVFGVFVLLFRQGLIGGLSNLLKLPLYRQGFSGVSGSIDSTTQTMLRMSREN